MDIKLGIVGSRTRDAPKYFDGVYSKFRELQKEYNITMIVSGGCKTGADRFAETIASIHNIPIKIHHPQWQKFGKAAGPIRNSLIVEDSDVLIACASNDGKKSTSGTYDTITKFRNKQKGELYIV